MVSPDVSQGQGASQPEWIRVLPLGRVELADQREPFVVTVASLAAMVEAFRSRGVDLVIDYEHQSLQGERAPAAGWVKDLEARTDGLWARVEWTQQARDYLEKREYRYFSPVLRLDPDTRAPLALMHVGLTNVPAINHLPPLVARWGGAASAAGEVEPGNPAAVTPMLDATKKKVEMVEQLNRLMGLAPETEEILVCGKALEAFHELAALMSLPMEVTLAQLQGTVEALKAGAERLLQVEAELQALKSLRAAEAADRMVEEVLQAGKISPAQRDWALEYCRRDPEGFRAYADRAPKQVPTGEELQILKERPGDEPGVLPEELAVCRALNITPAAYLQAKAQTGQRSAG